MDVSIIIVNYNTLSLSEACICSIIQNTKEVEYEILLIDNASTDGSVEHFIKDPRVSFIESGANLGFGKANNLAFKQSKGKYIFLLNSDTVLRNNAVKLMYDKMEQLPSSVAVLGTQLIGRNGGHCHSYSIFPSIEKCWTEIRNIYLKKHNEFEDNTYEGPVDYVTGADMFVRRSVIEAQGLFDPDFFMYFEESHLQYRYRKIGFQSHIFKDADIVHLEGGSNKGKSISSWEMYFNGMFIFMKKRYSKMKYIAFRLVALLYFPIIVRKQKSLRDMIVILHIFFRPAKPMYATSDIL